MIEFAHFNYLSFAQLWTTVRRAASCDDCKYMLPWPTKSKALRTYIEDGGCKTHPFHKATHGPGPASSSRSAQWVVTMAVGRGLESLSSFLRLPRVLCPLFLILLCTYNRQYTAAPRASERERGSMCEFMRATVHVLHPYNQGTKCTPKCIASDVLRWMQ